MTCRVAISAQAEADLERLLAKLSESSPKAAGRTRPLSSGLAYESPVFPEDLHHLLFWANSRRKYRALFVVREDTAHVLCIRAPGEKPIRPEAIKA
jgi:hypothetical protein